MTPTEARIDELIRQSCEDIGCDLDSPAGRRTATAIRSGYNAGLRDAAKQHDLSIMSTTVADARAHVIAAAIEALIAKETT